ncbi:MAG: GNAT family N-acetyltransferase [Deltaproteobacteria bacterium]|nr:GNAT family N-acetyltransferase [Deltaproteobacteria bacterium]
MTLPNPILTARLSLTPLTPADFDELIAVYRKPTVMRYIEPGRSEQKIREGFARHLAAQAKLGFASFVARGRDTRALVGNGLLFERTPGAPMELGYMLDEPYWGQGYASELCRALMSLAFDQLHLPRVIAGVLDGNVASIQVLLKLGFRETGRVTAADGGLDVRFELLPAQWAAAQAPGK